MPLLIFTFDVHLFPDPSTKLESSGNLKSPKEYSSGDFKESYGKVKTINPLPAQNNFMSYDEQDDLNNDHVAFLEDIYHESNNHEGFAESTTLKEMTNLDRRNEGTSRPLHRTICSLFRHKEGAICLKIKPHILKLLFRSIKQCQASGDIVLTNYILMYRYMNSFLSSFGGFAAIQSKMLEDRLKQLENYTLGSNGSHYQKLFQMVYFEVSTGYVANLTPFSGTVLFTCLHRHLQFLTLALEYVLALEPHDSLTPAFKSAYEEILSSHHIWFVKSVYNVGMSLLPINSQAALLLSIRQMENFALEELQESLKSIVSELKTLNNVTESMLVQTNALSVVPTEVVT